MKEQRYGGSEWNIQKESSRRKHKKFSWFDFLSLLFFLSNFFLLLVFIFSYCCVEEDVVVDMNEISRIGVGNGEEESSDEDNETELLNKSRAKLNSGKIGRAVRKMSDEMIGVSIPRKARTGLDEFFML